MDREHALTAIVPSNNLDASEAFYRRLGFEHYADVLARLDRDKLEAPRNLV